MSADANKAVTEKNDESKSDRDVKRELSDLTVIDDSDGNKKAKKGDSEKEQASNKIHNAGSHTTENDALILDDADLDNEVLSVVNKDLRFPKKTVGAEPNRTAKDKDTSSEKRKEPPKFCGRSLWVSNVSKSLKACTLKQHFCKHGKVTTAKIVTDGKNFYGYLSFETRKDSEKCMKKLDGTLFEGKHLKLSFARPPRQEYKRKADDNDPLTTKFSRSRTRSPSYKDRLSREKRETERLKRRVLEQEERNRQERRRQKQRDEEQRELQWKLKLQRKQLQIEREMFEKERKEVIRLDEERRRIEEERLEIMREKAKLEEELRRARKADKRGRSAREEDEKRRTLDVKSKVCRKEKSKERYVRAPPAPKLSESTSKTKAATRSYEPTTRRKIETIHRERKSFGQHQETWKIPVIGRPFWNGWKENGQGYQGYSGARVEGCCYYAPPSGGGDDDYARYQHYGVHLDRKY